MDPINAFFNQFGGKIDFFTVCLFALAFLFICSLIKNNAIRLSFSILFSFFVMLQFSSLFFTQTFVGYQFYIHSNLKGVTGISGLYYPQLIIGFILLIVLTLIFYFSYKFKRVAIQKHSQLIETKVNVAIGVISLLIFFTVIKKSDFVKDSKTLLISLKPTKDKLFAEILEKNGLLDYTLPSDIVAEKGQNIIIISVESLEKAFLISKKFQDLTPNLQRLKSEWKYYPMTQNSGSGWTSGSLYTCFTGFPAYFGISGNDIFQNSYYSGISSIADVLQAADYKTTYMNGNTEHSGVDNMLFTFGIDKVIDVHNVEKTGHESRYGLRDKDIFRLAKDEIVSLKGNTSPFALFISTTDTHNPDGIYDNRM